MARPPKHSTYQRNDMMARAVCEAALVGIKATAPKYGISERTLGRWIKKVGGDEELTALAFEKKRLADREWIADVPKLLQDSVTFLRKGALDGDYKDPHMIHAIAGAMKLAAESSLHWQVLGARIARETRQGDEAARQAVPNESNSKPAGVIPIRRAAAE